MKLTVQTLSINVRHNLGALMAAIRRSDSALTSIRSLIVSAQDWGIRITASALFVMALPLTASAQVWTVSEEAARDAITKQSEQVRLSEAYLETVQARFETAEISDIQVAQTYRSAQDLLLSQNMTLQALRSERAQTENTRKQAILDQRIDTLRTQVLIGLRELEPLRLERVKSLAARNAEKSAVDEAAALNLETEHDLSKLKLQMAEYFANQAPPILEEVEVLRKDGETLYLGTWRPKEDELRERIALADAIIIDYDDKVAEHRRRLDQWIEIGIQQKEEYVEAEQAYLEFFQTFDEESLWPVHLQWRQFGSGLWQTIGADAANRTISVYNNQKNFGGAGGAVAYELAWTAYDGYAWYNGETRNPTWDVTFNGSESKADWWTAAVAGADKAKNSIIAWPSAKKVHKNKPLSKITKGTLIALYRHVKPSENVKIEELRRLYKAGELSAAFSENMVHGSTPTALFASPKRAVGSKAFTDYWKSPSAISGSVKRKLFSRSAYIGYARSLFLSALNKAVLSRVEEQRLILLADVNSAYDNSKWTVNRVIAERMFLNQALEHKEMLIAEREDLRRILANQRGDRFVLEAKPNGILGGRDDFELWLTFSRPVIVGEVTIHDKQIILDQTVSGGQASKVWKGVFDLEDLSELSRVVVEAKDDVSGKRLADPRRPPRWDADRGRFERYTEKPDGHHHLRLLPIEDGTATAIVFDTSGSMENDGKIIAAKRAMRRLFSKMDQGRPDVFGVFTFDDCRVRVAQPIDGSVQKAREAIAETEPHGDTPLAAAIRAATDSLLNETSKSKLSLMVVSDGEDTCGGQWQLELDRASRLLSEANLEIIR